MQEEKKASLSDKNWMQETTVMDLQKRRFTVTTDWRHKRREVFPFLSFLLLLPSPPFDCYLVSLYLLLSIH